MKAVITYVQEIPCRPRLVDLALSATLAGQWFSPVVVHTTIDVVRALRMLGLGVEFRIREQTRLPVWSLHKVQTYAEERDEPFAHLDSDAFVLGPVPERVLRAPLFAQSPEGPEYYPGISSVPDWAVAKYLPSWPTWRAYNVGIVGGYYPAFFSEFRRRAFALAEATHCAANVAEQAVFGRLAMDLGIRVETLFQSHKFDPLVPFAHAMASKDHPYWRAKIRARLEVERPGLVASIDRLHQFPDTDLQPSNSYGQRYTPNPARRPQGPDPQGVGFPVPQDR